MIIIFLFGRMRFASNGRSQNTFVYTLDLTLFRMGFFGAAHGCGEGRGGRGVGVGVGGTICHPYLTMMKLGTVILYLKKIQKVYEKVYESRDTRLQFC